MQRLAATSITVENVDGLQQDLSSVDSWLESLGIHTLGEDTDDDGQHPAGTESTGRSRFETH